MTSPLYPLDAAEVAQRAGDVLTLARRINHDLRSPLGAISTMSELISEVLKTELPEHAGLVTPIVESTRQMLDLIKNVTLVLRASYGDDESWSTVEMDSVLDLALARVESRRQKAGATVTVAQGFPSVHVEPEWLSILWVHLLSNAIAHGGNDIRIGWEAVAAPSGEIRSHRFWVRDNGPGLSPEREAEPFPAFETLHAHTAVTGLGLSIARRLAELLHGQIAYQRLDGGWTEFSFELPVESAADRTPAAPSKQDEVQALPPFAANGKETTGSPADESRRLSAFFGLLTPDGLLVEVNAAALEVAGLRFDDVIGRPLADAYWWSHSPEAQGQLRAAITAAAAGAVVRCEPVLRVAPERFIRVDFSLSPLTDAHGTVTHLVLSGLDLTRRLEAENALAESELRFRTLANNISQFAWMADDKGSIFWYNQRWFDFTGIRHEDVAAGDWRKIVHHPDHMERVITKYYRCIQAGEVWEDTFPLRGVDGNYRWFLSRATPVHDGEGKVVQWFGTNTDITDQLATEEALRRASQAKDDFIAVLSHELRTPLNPALLIASEAATRKDLPEDVRADFDVIRRNIEVEARLIDDLLDLTRISRGKLPLVLSTVSVDSLIIEALANVRSEADSKGVVMDAVLEPGRTFLQGDDVRLRQVLWNVLRNAVKFTPASGTITLSTRTVGSMFQITVKDSGIGMSMEELARVFEPFSQGEHSADESEHRFGGLGLGLAISKLLVEQHGGKILARSEGRNRGTTVIIELPRSNAVPAAVEVPDERDSHYHASHDHDHGHEPAMSILLVEDHDATRQTLAALLERRGHRVTQADTVSAAGDLAVSQSFDLLMSDIGLPDGRGDELMARIRDVQPAMFAIALSGYGMESDIQRSRSAGFALHLTKPVSLQELERALRRIGRWRNATGATSMATEVLK